MLEEPLLQTPEEYCCTPLQYRGIFQAYILIKRVLFRCLPRNRAGLCRLTCPSMDVGSIQIQTQRPIDSLFRAFGGPYKIN